MSDPSSLAALELELKKLVIEALALEDIEPEEIVSEDPLFVEGLGLDSIDANVPLSSLRVMELSPSVELCSGSRNALANVGYFSSRPMRRPVAMASLSKYSRRGYGSGCNRRRAAAAILVPGAPASAAFEIRGFGFALTTRSSSRDWVP